MTDKHTPKSRYFLTELNDGIQWLTDGQDFGMHPDAALGLLKALGGLEKTMREQLSALVDTGKIDAGETSAAFAQARKAIKAAKGDA